MKEAQYDPEVHHRRSIRLKGHDYAGDGLYFVTICAHREFIQFAKENPFGVGAGNGATQVTPVLGLIEERMRVTAEKCPFMKWEEAVIMPDHFHALIRLRGGQAPLGDVIGGFKAAVSREIHRRGDIHVALSVPQRIRIWHRNYYEAIVRTPEEAERIAEYIRMNPWRCVTELRNGLRGMGNPALWSAPKLGVLCSRNAPRQASIPNAEVYMGGFHSPMEKEIFTRLLEHKKPLIWCPAWGLNRAAFAPGVRDALEQNRMLILEMRNRDGDLAAAEERNTFVMRTAAKLWIPHISPGGMLATLIERLGAQNKTIGNQRT
jgi:REP element-mobilizing transposase RayT